MVAWDSRLKRLTFFRPSGAVRSTTSVPTGGVASAHGYDELRTDVAGGVLVYTVAQVDGELRGATLRVDREGKVLDVLNRPAEGRVGPTRGNRFYGFGTMSAFAGLTLSALGPDGRFWSGRTDEYALWRPIGDGRALRIERSWTPLRVERGMHRETEARIEHFSPRTGEDPDQDVTDTKPAFWHLWVDQEGRFWVATHNAASNVGETEAERETRQKYDNPPVVWWEPFICDVISADGEFLGTVRFPNRNTRIHVAQGRWLWVVEEGEYGEHYVVRYRIESR